MTIELARRAVACPGWRWLPGMACINAVMPDAWCARIGDERKPTFNHYLPDLNDPCSIGGLLSLVRDAWGTQTAWVEPGHDGRCEVFVYVSGECLMLASYDSEVEALVAALEAASVRAGGEE